MIKADRPVVLPSLPPLQDEKTKPQEENKSKSPTDSPPAEEEDFDALTKRFAALKRR